MSDKEKSIEELWQQTLAAFSLAKAQGAGGDQAPETPAKLPDFKEFEAQLDGILGQAIERHLAAHAESTGDHADPVGDQIEALNKALADPSEESAFVVACPNCQTELPLDEASQELFSQFDEAMKGLNENDLLMSKALVQIRDEQARANREFAGMLLGLIKAISAKTVVAAEAVQKLGQQALAPSANASLMNLSGIASAKSGSNGRLSDADTETLKGLSRTQAIEAIQKAISAGNTSLNVLAVDFAYQEAARSNSPDGMAAALSLIGESERNVLLGQQAKQ